MNKTVTHQAIHLNWPGPTKINSPKTLVLGSFNPFDNNVKAVDYYYGRHSNFFWPSIAEILKEKSEYFFDADQGFARKISVMQDRFICLDVINNIEFETENIDSLNMYLEGKIFSNFKDQNIWVSKTKASDNSIIKLKRNYNESIIEFLESSGSIIKVIHTMGVGRLSDMSANPKEKKLGDLGFQGFIDKIREICNRRKIDFLYESYSPSAYAVKNGYTDRLILKEWMKNNLWF